MDDQARTSMAEDVARGRPTEIDALCGEVVRLAAAAGLTAPHNAWMVQRLSRVQPGRMSPPGRPKGEYRSAQREGTPMSGREMRQALGM